MRQTDRHSNIDRLVRKQRNRDKERERETRSVNCPSKPTIYETFLTRERRDQTRGRNEGTRRTQE